MEEHSYTRSSDEKQRERDLVGTEFVPLTETQLNFWEKMKELQYKMLIGSQDKIEGHMFENESPLSWLTLSQGIAYWISTDSNVITINGTFHTFQVFNRDRSGSIINSFVCLLSYLLYYFHIGVTGMSTTFATGTLHLSLKFT